MLAGEGLPSVVRSYVVAKASYSDYRAELRFDFWFSCAYCSISEAEAFAIPFQIDHFAPQVGGGLVDVHAYENLMWCCGPCNRSKSNVWPDEELQALGYRYLRPDRDCFIQHFKLQGVRLVPQTPPAEFTHNVLNLDRAVLRSVRELRSRIVQNAEAIANGLHQLIGRRIDTLRPDARLVFEDARKTAMSAVQRLEEDLVQASDIRLINQSPLPVFEGADKEQTKRRREYLAGLNALVPKIE